MSLWGVESNRSVGSKQGQISARYKIAQIFQKSCQYRVRTVNRLGYPEDTWSLPPVREMKKKK